MGKRGPKPKEKIEISKIKTEGYCPVSVYCKRDQNEIYQFVDIRMNVDFKEFSKIEVCSDFTEENIDIVERQKRYYTSKIFDCDYNFTMRRKVQFKVMYDLYQILWSIDSVVILNSAETIISPNQAITRWNREAKKKNKAGRNTVDWDNIEAVRTMELDNFLFNIAIIGNFLPVPAKEQDVLNKFAERFDYLLIAIKNYYKKNIINKHFDETILSWLNEYKNKEESKNNEAWHNFVDNNYLKGSFVDNEYDVIRFDGTLNQLSKMIYGRSVIMIKEYEKRLNNRKSSYSAINSCIQEDT